MLTSQDIKQLSPDALRRAAEVKEQIEALEGELSAILGGETPSPAKKSARRGRPAGKTPAKKKSTKKKRKLSPEGLARIKAAQAKRWAKVKSKSGKKAAKPKPAKKKTAKKKRTMSPEARERIAAAQRKRWAKAKGTK